MKKESVALQKKRTKKIVTELKKLYPEATCSLEYQTPFQLLIATMLSAQTTDLMVNRITPTLFHYFGTAEKMAQASLEELESHLRKIGLFRTKARNCQKTAQILENQFQGKVPNRLDLLLTFPGVGRKTANVVLGNAFQIPAMVVDTHVKRITYRLGLTSERNPEKIEKDLEKRVAQKDWILFTHLIIRHGRALCKAQKPHCNECILEPLCFKREL
ncbi:MAG: endonuclease III [Planctomycetota bacterium]